MTAVVWGFSILMTYVSTPGAGVDARARFARHPNVSLDASRPTLIVFAHPCCPCTRATIAELDRLACRCPGRARFVVVFEPVPLDESDAVISGRWEAARKIPGVDVQLDVEGQLACDLGVRTSGQTLLYAPDGTLRFSGGITPARGHVGDNEGEDAIERYLRGDSALIESTPVYGCPLAPRGGQIQNAQ